jgi:hypothetical protein
MKMEMNSKTAGIVFLFVCLLIVLFIGQWVYLGSSSSKPMYLGAMSHVREGATSGPRTSGPRTSGPRTTRLPHTEKPRTTRLPHTEKPRTTRQSVTKTPQP